MAFFLIFIGIAVMQYLMPKPPPQPQKPETPQPTQSQPQAPATATPAVTAPAPAVTKGKHPASATPSVPLVPVKQAEGETETVIETNLYRVAFTNRGGQVKSWVLKKDRHYLPEDVELVNPVSAPVLGYPLSIFTYDQDLQKKLNEALYVP